MFSPKCMTSQSIILQKNFVRLFFSVYTITLLKDVVKFSTSALKWFKIEPNLSYCFGLTNKGPATTQEWKFKDTMEIFSSSLRELVLSEKISKKGIFKNFERTSRILWKWFASSIKRVHYWNKTLSPINHKIFTKVR